MSIAESSAWVNRPSTALTPKNEPYPIERGDVNIVPLSLK
jgi:hypothetical protein